MELQTTLKNYAAWKSLQMYLFKQIFETTTSNLKIRLRKIIIKVWPDKASAKLNYFIVFKTEGFIFQQVISAKFIAFLCDINRSKHNNLTYRIQQFHIESDEIMAPKLWRSATVATAVDLRPPRSLINYPEIISLTRKRW